MIAVTAPETLPNLLRAAALIVRTTHGPSCPDRAVHECAAAFLTRIADAEASGHPLRARELDAALRIARTYLTV